MQTKPSAKAICGRIFSSIFMLFAIICFIGSWVKIDSLESKHELQHLFTGLKEKAEVVGELQKTTEGANLDVVIDGLGDVPIKRFTKVMTKMNNAIDNQGISPSEMLYPFAFYLIGSLDKLSEVNTYSIEQRQAFYEIEGFIIAIVVGLLLTFTIDLLAIVLKVLGKTGFFNVVSAVLHFALLIIMLILTLGLTGYMEKIYSDVVFTITGRPGLAFLFALISAIFAMWLRDKKVKKDKKAKNANIDEEPVAEELNVLPTVESELAKENN